jgi:PadR family transcriptional regulator PadR
VYCGGVMALELSYKKSILEVFVLAILDVGESYGYKIVTDLNQYIEISESTLYPILRRLEMGNKLSTHNQIISGRIRKYYKITELGEATIKDFLKEWEDIRKINDILSKAKLAKGEKGE